MTVEGQVARAEKKDIESYNVSHVLQGEREIVCVCTRVRMCVCAWEGGTVMQGK